MVGSRKCLQCELNCTDLVLQDHSFSQCFSTKNIAASTLHQLPPSFLYRLIVFRLVLPPAVVVIPPIIVRVIAPPAVWLLPVPVSLIPVWLTPVLPIHPNIVAHEDPPVVPWHGAGNPDRASARTLSQTAANELGHSTLLGMRVCLGLDSRGFRVWGLHCKTKPKHEMILLYVLLQD